MVYNILANEKQSEVLYFDSLLEGLKSLNSLKLNELNKARMQDITALCEIHNIDFQPEINTFNKIAFISKGSASNKRRLNMDKELEKAGITFE